jgi:hypothetical protein
MSLNNSNEKETTTDTNNNNFFYNDIQINRKLKTEIITKAENARNKLKKNQYLIEKIENLKSKSKNIKILLNKYINNPSFENNNENFNKIEIKKNVISDINNFNNSIKEENFEIKNKIEKFNEKISSLSNELQQEIPEKENLNELKEINFKLIFDIKKLENIYKRYIEDYKLILDSRDTIEESFFPEETVIIINDMTDELIFYKDELQKKINLMSEINNQNQEKFQLYCNLRNKHKILKRRFNYLKNMKTVIMETDKEYELSTMNQIPIDKENEMKENDEEEFLFKDFELNSSINSNNSSISSFDHNKKISEIKEETDENEEKLDKSTTNKKEEEEKEEKIFKKKTFQLNRVLSMDLNDIGSVKNIKKENFEDDFKNNINNNIKIKLNGEDIEKDFDDINNYNRRNNSNVDLYMVNKDLKLERDINNKNYIKLQIDKIKKKHRDSIEKSLLEQKKFYKMINKNLKKEIENKKNKIENFELYYEDIKKKFNNEFDNLQEL